MTTRDTIDNIQTTITQAMDKVTDSLSSTLSDHCLQITVDQVNRGVPHKQALDIAIRHGVKTFLQQMDAGMKDQVNKLIELASELEETIEEQSEREEQLLQQIEHLNHSLSVEHRINQDLSVQANQQKKADALPIQSVESEIRTTQVTNGQIAQMVMHGPHAELSRFARTDAELKILIKHVCGIVRATEATNGITSYTTLFVDWAEQQGIQVDGRKLTTDDIDGRPEVRWLFNSWVASVSATK